jgi:hypothetical protein
MSFVFYYAAKSGASVTVTLPSPERDNVYRRKKILGVGRTMGGTIRVYDKGTQRLELDLEFRDLTDTQKVALDGFINTNADGSVNAFQVDDIHGTCWNARFIQTEFEFIEEGAETLPVTNPLWRITLKLEVWA